MNSCASISAAATAAGAATYAAKPSEVMKKPTG